MICKAVSKKYYLLGSQGKNNNEITCTKFSVVFNKIMLFAGFLL